MDPDEARRRILEELAHCEYRTGQSFFSWLLNGLQRLLSALLDGIGGSESAGGWIAAALAVILVLTAVAVVRRTGVLRRRAAVPADPALDADPTLPAEELLARARTARDEHRPDAAVILAVRSLVRDLEVRTLLDVTDGMTAHEAATGAARAFPDLRARLSRAADAFDTAAYSARSASAKQAEDAVRLAEFVAQSAPDPAALTGPAAGAGA